MINDCWNKIGVWGDRSCPELKAAIHCRNCPVYSAAGRNLLERAAPTDYLNEWTNLLAGEEANTRFTSKDTISVVIFRLRGEWLALPTSLFKEVTEPCIIHTLPHRSNHILMGIVNIRGEIQMCISLEGLLGIDTADDSKRNLNQVAHKRMAVVEKEGNLWVFSIDELFGVHRVHSDQFRNVPATISKVKDTFTKAIVNWQGKGVSYLDDELLFYTLNRKVL